MVKTKDEEKTVNDLIKTVMEIIILIIILGYALITLIEELTLDVWMIAQSNYAWIIAAIPLFMCLAILIYVLKRNGLWYD